MHLAEKVSGITSPVWCWNEVGDVGFCVPRAENKAEVLGVLPQSYREQRSGHTEEGENDGRNKKVQ